MYAAYHWDLRRVLAFHSISQIGYILLAVALASPAGDAAAILFMLHHSLVKAALILTAALVFHACGHYDLRRIGGLYAGRPWLSLVFLLGFLGAKMLLTPQYPLADGVALLTIGAILAAGGLLSAWLGSRAAAPVSPLADDLGALLVLTVKGARRIVVLVIGSTVVLIGIAMIVLPGPAVVVIPAGLAILATEFLWARRLLQRLRHEARTLAEGARGLFGRKKAAAGRPENERGE